MRKAPRPALGGTHLVRPRGVEVRYGITQITRWRWERAGKLPPRDVCIGGVLVGWRPQTLEAADRGKPIAPRAPSRRVLRARLTTDAASASLPELPQK